MRVILGIDPGIARNKPIAIALVEFGAERRILWFCHARVTAHYVDERIHEWVAQLARGISVADNMGKPIAMVAIEDARSRGRGGANLQHLVNVLAQRARGVGLRVELVNPIHVKLHATGKGNTETPVVALYVRTEYKGADRLPNVTGEYDLEMAVAVAGAGYAKLQEEALRQEQLT